MTSTSSLEALIGDPSPLGARAWLVVLSRARSVRRLCESPALRPILDDAERALVHGRLSKLEDDLLARALAEPADGAAREPRAAGVVAALEAVDLRSEVASLLGACVPSARFKLAPDGRIRRTRPAQVSTTGKPVGELIVSTSGPLPVAVAPAPASPAPAPAPAEVTPALVIAVPPPLPAIDLPAVTPPTPSKVATGKFDELFEVVAEPTPAPAKAKAPTEPPVADTPDSLGRLVKARRRTGAVETTPERVAEAARRAPELWVARAKPTPSAPTPPVPAPPAPTPPRPRRRRGSEDETPDGAGDLSPFLQKKNILVGLVLGALIVLAGSVKLSVEIWRLDDALYKYALFVAASLGLYGLGELCTRKLGLRLTGRAFLGTFALLVPLDLLAADALDVPWPGAIALAVALVAAAWRAVEPLVGRGRAWFTPAYAVVAAHELVVGALAGPTSPGQDVAPLSRYVALLLAAVGAAVAVAGVTAYGHARATPDERDRDSEPILAGLLLLLPGLLLLARTAIAAEPNLGGLAGPVLLGLAAVPLEVARLLRADRTALAAADGGEVDPATLAELLAQIGAGLLAVAGLCASVFDPVAALACGVVGVIVLGRALRQDPTSDPLLVGVVALGTFAWAALVGVVAGEGIGLRRWLPSGGADAAILYAPIAAALLVGAHAAARGSPRAAWLRTLGQFALVSLALVLTGARETGAIGLGVLGVGLVLLATLDRRVEHAGAGLVLLALASVAPGRGLSERFVERAPWLAAAGLVCTSAGHVATSLFGARRLSRPSVLGRAAFGVGPGLSVAALLGLLLLTPALGPTAERVAVTSIITSLALAVAAHARPRDGSPWSWALLPLTLAPGVAALTMLSRGPGRPFLAVLHHDDAARTALALGLEGALVAFGAALWTIRRLSARDADEAPPSALSLGATVVALSSLVPALAARDPGPALLLLGVAIAATSVTLDVAVLASLGGVVAAISAPFLAAPHGEPWLERLTGITDAVVLAVIAEVALALLLRRFFPSSGSDDRARERVVGSAERLLEAAAGMAALATLPAAICAPWPGGQEALLLCWIALGPAAFALRSGALMRVGLLALLVALGAIVSTHVGPPLESNPLLLGATVATLVGGVLGELGRRRALLVGSARDATFLIGTCAAVAALVAPPGWGAFTAPLVFGIVGLRAASRSSGQAEGLGAIATLALSLAAARGVLLLAGDPWRLGAGSTTLACLAASIVPVVLRAALVHLGASADAAASAPWIARVGCVVAAINAIVAGGLQGAAAFVVIAAVFLASFLERARRADAWAALTSLAVATILAVSDLIPHAAEPAERGAATLAALAALGALFGALSGPRADEGASRWPVLRDVLGQAALGLGVGLGVALWVASSGEAAARLSRHAFQLDLLTSSLTLGATLLLVSQAALVVRRDGIVALLVGWGAVVLLGLRIAGHAAPVEAWAATLPMAPALAGLAATLLVTSWPSLLRGPGEDGPRRAELLQTLGAGTAIVALAIAIPCDLVGRAGGPGLAVSAGVALVLAAMWRREDLAHAGMGGLSLAAYTTTFRVLDVSPAHPERAIVGAAIALALCFVLRTLALAVDGPRIEGVAAPRIAARVHWTWAIVNSLAAFAALGLFCVLFYPHRHVAPAPWEVVLAAVALCLGAAALHIELARRLRHEVFVYLAEVALGGIVLVVWVARPDLSSHGLLRAAWPIFVLVIAFVLTGAGTLLERARLDLFSVPVQRSAIFLPLAPVLFGWLADERANAGGLALSAILYATTATLRGTTWPWIPAVLLGNAALWKLLAIGHLPPLSRPELYVAPVGLTLAGVGRKLRSTHPKEAVWLRESGAVLVLAALTVALLIDDTARLYEALGLAVASIVGVLLGIAWRLRTFVVLGAAFLAIDLTANAWWLSKEAAWVWWVWVVTLGLAVIALFSSFERLRNVLGPAATDDPAESTDES